MNGFKCPIEFRKICYFKYFSGLVFSPLLHTTFLNGNLNVFISFNISLSLRICWKITTYLLNIFFWNLKFTSMRRKRNMFIFCLAKLLPLSCSFLAWEEASFVYLIYVSIAIHAKVLIVVSAFRNRFRFSTKWMSANVNLHSLTIRDMV